MLFLTRHLGERIILSDKATGVKIADIIVKELSAEIVNLGINAPISVKITRDSIKGKNGKGTDG